MLLLLFHVLRASVQHRRSLIRLRGHCLIIWNDAISKRQSRPKQLSMNNDEIPIANLDTHTPENTHHYSKSILENEVAGVHVEHIAISGEQPIVEYSKHGFRTIYLFIKGSGNLVAQNKNYEIVPESIFLPNAVENFSIESSNDNKLHYLKISCELSDQDQVNLNELPAENTQRVYYAKFSDCQSYSEAIKSPNTVSRTILSNEYIPRIAMGTVQTKGPDQVAAHSHPMLEQLFFGLSGNECIVYADNVHVNFPPLSLLHIPLGSSHSVAVDANKNMYYVWMDFFLDKKGEQWLETHNVNSDN